MKNFGEWLKKYKDGILATFELGNINEVRGGGATEEMYSDVEDSVKELDKPVVNKKIAKSQNKTNDIKIQNKTDATDVPDKEEIGKAIKAKAGINTNINKPISTYNTLEKYPDVEDEIISIFGNTFTSDEELENSDNVGLFYKISEDKKGVITKKLCVSTNSPALEIIKSDEHSVFIDSGAWWVYTLPSGTELRMHQSSKKKGFKYITNTTAFQESVFAMLMQLKVSDFEMPMPTDKKLASYPVSTWLTSLTNNKPTIVASQIFKDVPGLDYNVPANDVETFINEVKTILSSNSNGWRNSFEAVWKVDWKERLNSIYVKPPKWTKPLFIHDNLRFSEDLKKAAGNFLRGNRCGQQKDTIDKTDVLLVFNGAEASRIFREVAAFTTKADIPAHNKYINDLINKGELLGISLKQTGKNVVVSAVNFNIKTTAVGDNIKDENKVVIKFDTKNPKNSTLNCAGAIMPQFNDKVVTYKILIPINKSHTHDMHIDDVIGENKDANIAVIIRVAGGKSQLNFMINGTKAFLGKGNQAMAGDSTNTKEYQGINITQIWKEGMEAGRSSAESIYNAVEKVYQLIIHNPPVFNKIFAKSVGYPLAIIDGSKVNYELASTPYVKIY